MMSTIASTTRDGFYQGQFGIALEIQLMKDLVFGKNNPNNITKNNGDNIIIVGGELFNKGAQAMTFTVVDEMSKRYPNKEIYLFSSMDYKRTYEDKNKYNFSILPWHVEEKGDILLNGKNGSTNNKEVVNELSNALSNCFMMIDINGYKFSSQWGWKMSLMYLSNIVIANKYSIPMYILPQSISPFDYKKWQKYILNPFMNMYLPYPEIILPRESHGVENLLPYTKHNVRKEFDIVLQNKDEYEIQNIFKKEPELQQFTIDNDSVGIVPNSRLLERIDSSLYFSINSDLISEILEAGNTVFILRHSVEDRHICEKIYSDFKHNTNVNIIKEDLNAIELENIISQFNYLVASRYHSIIHAYKNNIPVIAYGWAQKYEEILKQFNQEKYFFEGRKNINVEESIKAVHLMEENYMEESKNILNKRKDITKENLFDVLF